MRTIHVYDQGSGEYLRTIQANDPERDKDGNIVFGKLAQGMTEVPLPAVPVGQQAYFADGAWTLKKIPVQEPSPEPTAEEQEKEALRFELLEKEQSLKDSDYKIIKCVELGLDIDKEYPGIRVQRQSERDRINAIRGLLGEDADA